MQNTVGTVGNAAISGHFSHASLHSASCVSATWQRDVNSKRARKVNNTVPQQVNISSSGAYTTVISPKIQTGCQSLWRASVQQLIRGFGPVRTVQVNLAQ
eukprot:TRINITY_DN96001_c0_g1_i1.p2 TRINITY_DN96001_c0_g1~~TRINITY_DN96001_c0_g1_i1.p2  ORF type:complete len:100 (-),score=3.65 TRINITY_DN96001_c0_g1_i1:205-504(-)